LYAIKEVAYGAKEVAYDPIKAVYIGEKHVEAYEESQNNV